MTRQRIRMLVSGESPLNRRKPTNQGAGKEPLRAPSAGGPPRGRGGAWRWFLLSGAFFVLHLMLLRQSDLELQGISIHLALLGLLSGLLLGAAGAPFDPAGRPGGHCDHETGEAESPRC